MNLYIRLKNCDPVSNCSVSCPSWLSGSMPNNHWITSIATSLTNLSSLLTKHVIQLQRLYCKKCGLYLSLAWDEPTTLVLIDLSAAFDTINHQNFLGYLRSWFDLSGTSLEWYIFYMSDCCKEIVVGSTLSDYCKLIYGIPKGSVLDPLLSSLHTIMLSKIIASYPHIKLYF